MSDLQIKKSERAEALAVRIELGAKNVASLAERLTDSEWQTPVNGDGRSIGVVIHHVASSYPVEIHLAKMIASGEPITGVTKAVVDDMNAKHAQENSSIDKQETLDLLSKNSHEAADAVRELSDVELDNAELVSLNFDAPLTTQFFIEDHALRHSFHHLGKIKETLNQ